MLRLLAQSGGMPHGYCLLWQEPLVWLHAASDSLIAIAYFTIPVTLIYFIRQRRDIPFSWLFVCFGVFILACGATHALGVYNIWVPDWWLAGGVKAVTALASVPTAILLGRSVPQLLAIPSPGQLERANHALRAEVIERQRIETELRGVQAGLEVKVAERTAELSAANAALRRSESRLGAIIGSAMDAIISAESDGRIVLFNPAAEAMFDLPTDDAIGRRLDEFLPGWRAEAGAPGSHERPVHRELEALRSGGRSFPAEVTVSRAGAPDGHHTVIVRDVSERVRSAEALRRSEEQLRHAQKMEAVGRLAGGVAHDFNNLLTVIVGHLEFAKGSLPPASDAAQDLEHVGAAASRATALTRQLLAFSRRQVLEVTDVDLNDVVVRVGGMLRRLLGDDITVTTELASDLGSVRADPGQLELILLNLAVNARDAMPQGGTVSIETENVSVSEHWVEQPHVEPGSYVVLAVSDTGHGMAPDVQARIFEPFFTTKEAGKGTGLGLSTVHGIVAQLHGAITVYSEPNAGATFKVYLPRSGAAGDRRDPKPDEAAVPTGSETVLLVEDHDAVRVVAERTLATCGYHVLAARDAQEALRLSREHPGPIHILLTDVIMPGMGGRPLAAELVQARPTTRVLFMSGFTNTSVVRQGILDDGVAYLQKPFAPQALARKIRDVLDAIPRP